MEFFAWIFGFLHFHRRIIIGAVLIGALAYWLLYGKDLVPRFQPKRLASQLVPSDSEPSTDSEQPADELTENTSSGSLDLGTGLNESKVEKLIDETVRLDASWPKETHSKASILVARKLKIARQLLELDSLTDLQRKFAEKSLIEAVSILDSLNVQGGLTLPNIREEMLREVEPYLDHDDADLQQIARLTMVCYPTYDFLTTPTEENLQLVEQRFNDYFSSLSESEFSQEKLCELVVRLQQVPELSEQTESFARRALEKFRTLDSEFARALSRMLEQRILFGRLDLPTLVERMQRSDTTADRDIESLKRGLKSLPSADLAIYQIALDVVRALIELEQQDRAIELLEFLRAQVIPQIENSEKRQSILKAMDEFKPFL